MVKCVECGRFMSADDFQFGHCEIEPLNEFGRERIEWSCKSCTEEQSTRSAGSAEQAPASDR